MPATTLPKQTLIVGTRTSKLALWQTEHVIQQVQAAWPGLACHVLTLVTRGDKTLDKPLPEIGGKGLFTAELEQALRDGHIDVAVHSLKDLPVTGAPGLALGAITSRADVRDGLVARNGWTLATLPQGAVVGTSSIRRQAQLLAARPDLTIKSIRGNVDTRVRKVLGDQEHVPEYDAAVLAVAGLQRLGLDPSITEWLNLNVMLPAPGQGALAVQCRADDTETLAILAAIDDTTVRAAVTAERAFLGSLGGGCSAPIAAHAFVIEPGEPALQMTAVIASPDGRQVVRVSGSDRDGQALGEQLARQALQQGADAILTALAGNQHLLVADQRPLPLQGRRIVVTRAEAQAQALCRQLVQLGAIPILLPTIAVVPLPDMRPLDRAITSLHDYDWVIFTSANGVTIFWERLTAVHGEGHTLAGVKVAAVGPATAEALRRRGVQPDFVPGEFVSEQIAAGLGRVAGQRILLPQAEIARRHLAEAMAAQGAVVDDIPTYRTLPAKISEAGLEALSLGVDAITFTSGSTVRNFLKAIDGKLLIEDVLIACIGPATAEVARDCGLQVDLVAGAYTTDGLVQALVEHFQSKM